MKTETALEAIIGRAPQGGSPSVAADIHGSEGSFSDCFGLGDVSPENWAVPLVPDMFKGVVAQPDLPLTDSGLFSAKFVDGTPIELPSVVDVSDIPAALPAGPPPLVALADAPVLDVDFPANLPADRLKSQFSDGAVVPDVQGNVAKETVSKGLVPNVGRLETGQLDPRLTQAPMAKTESTTDAMPAPATAIGPTPIAARLTATGSQDTDSPPKPPAADHPAPTRAAPSSARPEIQPSPEKTPQFAPKADGDTPAPVDKLPLPQTGKLALKTEAPEALNDTRSAPATAFPAKPALPEADKLVTTHPVEMLRQDRHPTAVASEVPTNDPLPSVLGSAKKPTERAPLAAIETPVRPVQVASSSSPGSPTPMTTVTTPAGAEPKAAAPTPWPQESAPHGAMNLQSLADHDDARLSKYGGEMGLTEISHISGQLHSGAVPKHVDRLEHLPRITAAIAEAARGLSNGPVEIALNPEELGRVRMTLHANDTAMMVAVSVDRPDTLDLLRRNIDLLVSSLREMGYDDVTLSYQGGEGDFAQREDQSDPEAHAGAGMASATDTSPDNVPVARLILGGTGGIDIRV